MDFKKYFKTLQDWKKLPAYRLEPRIDSYIGFFLPDILEELNNVEVVGVIPELPIRLGTVHPEHEGKNFAERSYKVDFYVFGADGAHYFIEVKSDSGSRRDSQDDYLNKSVGCGMRSVVEGIIRISKVSTYKDKYNHLLGKLRKLGVIDDNEIFASGSDEIQVIYIQPKILEGDENKGVIEFASIAQMLQRKYPNDEFTLEFAKALDVWSED